MGLKKAVVIMIMVLVAFVVSSCRGATAGEIWGYQKSNAAEPPPEKYVDDAKEATKSWTGWVTNKFSENLAFISKNKFIGGSKNTKDKISDTASG